MDRALDVDSIQALFYLKQPRTTGNAFTSMFFILVS